MANQAGDSAAQPTQPADPWHGHGAQPGKGDPWGKGKSKSGDRGFTWSTGGEQSQPAQQDQSPRSTRADRQSQSLSQGSDQTWSMVETVHQDAAADGGDTAQAAGSSDRPAAQQAAYPQADWWARDSRWSWEQSQAEDQWMQSRIQPNRGDNGSWNQEDTGTELSDSSPF